MRVTTRNLASALRLSLHNDLKCSHAVDRRARVPEPCAYYGYADRLPDNPRNRHERLLQTLLGPELREGAALLPRRLSERNHTQPMAGQTAPTQASDGVLRGG